jgi:hypothetical protein
MPSSNLTLSLIPRIPNLPCFDSLRAYGTTNKCSASLLVSRFYRIGYNALDSCRYRRLVLLVQLRLNSRFTPFQGKLSVQSFIIQLLKCVFSFSLSNKKSQSVLTRTSLF